MNRYVLLAGLALAIISAQTLGAATITCPPFCTYTYTGPDFYAADNAIPYADFPTYSTSDSVSWTITLDVPINFSAPAISDYGPNGTQDVLSFSITDGVQTLDTFGVNDLFEFGTTGWYVYVLQRPGLFGVGYVSIGSACTQARYGVIDLYNTGIVEIPGAVNEGFGSGELGLASCFAGGGAGSLIESSTPGPSAPEPSTLEMLLSAAILLLCAYYSRKGVSHPPAA